MIFASGQAKYRERMVEEIHDRAWAALAQVAFVRQTEMPPIMEDMAKAEARILECDEEIKEFGLAVDFHTVVNRERVRNLNVERNAISLRLNGSGAPNSRGLKQVLAELNMLVVEKQAEADRNLQLAEFASTWEYVPAEVPDAAKGTTGEPPRP